MSADQEGRSSQASFNKCSSSSEAPVGSTIAYEAMRIAREAAQPVPSGETVKGQIRRACRALGYRDGDWRIKAAWYGEADPWSARALEELRGRYSEWREKQERASLADAKTAATFLTAVANRFEGEGNASLDRQAIDRLRAIADRLGC